MWFYVRTCVVFLLLSLLNYLLSSWIESLRHKTLVTLVAEFGISPIQMAVNHVSLPKPFSSGNATEWFQRFDVCSKANGWNDATKALKLPTLLEGEAFAIWQELPQEKQESITEARKGIVEKLAPAEFVSMAAFHKRILRPGEALSLFTHDLKQLLTAAMPQVEGAARNQLLVHQFLCGLPDRVSPTAPGNRGGERSIGCC